MNSNWYVYLLECEDGSLYTGISTDSARRFEQHRNGEGARYTRSHPPRRLLANLSVGSRSVALRAEYAIKQLSASEKHRLCRDINAGTACIEAILQPAHLQPS